MHPACKNVTPSVPKRSFLRNLQAILRDLSDLQNIDWLTTTKNSSNSGTRTGTSGINTSGIRCE